MKLKKIPKLLKVKINFQLDRIIFNSLYRKYYKSQLYNKVFREIAGKIRGKVFMQACLI